MKKVIILPLSSQLASMLTRIGVQVLKEAAAKKR